jgi:hypothetical protein
MQWWQWFFRGLALLSAGGSHALSPAVRQQIDTTLSLTQLPTTPEAYKNSIVMLGGDILSTRNLTSVLPIHAAFRRRKPLPWKPFGFFR